MPTRRKASEDSAPTPSRSAIKTRTVSFRIPETSVIVLVAALMIISFLLGVLVTNVSYKLGNGQLSLGSNSATTGTTPTTGTTASTAPAAGTKVNVATGDFPALGDPNAKVNVIEFADFRCPFCEQVFTTVEPSIKKDFIDTGKIKFYFRQYAFLGPASTVAANAAECAQEQNAFWAFHDYMYQNQPPETDTSMYTTDNLTTVAGNLGMNTTQFNSCLSANKYQSKIAKDMSDGTAAGVTGTPATFVDGELISGACPLATFEGAINAALSSKHWSVDGNCALTVN